MDYFEEEARTQEEVVLIVREKHGSDAMILNYERQKKGFAGVVLGRETIIARGVKGNRSKSYAPSPKPAVEKEAFEVEKVKLLSAIAGNKNDQALTDLQKNVGTIMQILKENPKSEAPVHESVKTIEKLLIKNDFSYSYIRYIMDKINSEMAVKDLEDFPKVKECVLNWIGDTISIIEPDGDRMAQSPRVVVLVGPTGVGKTTTIAKLAANYTISDPDGKVKARIITIDAYRIGAKYQIEKYGEIMDIPVFSAETKEDLRNQILLNQDADYILIDTIGKSPRDYKIFAEMKEILDGCRSEAEVYLTMSATTKASDIEEIAKQFEPFNYRGVILTKLDETLRVGNIISKLYELNKSLAYITDGQGVPQDFEKASRRKLLINLEGFSYKMDGDLK